MKILGESMEVQKRQQPLQQEEGPTTKKRNNQANETNALTWFNLFLITVLVFNTTFTMTLIVKFYYVTIENTLILNQLLFGPKPQPREVMTDGVSFLFNFEQSALLRKEPLERSLECPPCPTPEPPTEVIPPNKDPVSVLNTEFGPRATYDCVYSCKIPPIHIATVKIEDHDKEYTGRGKSKQAAKQDAAYRAISESFTHLLEEVIHEVVVYNPECQDDRNSNITEMLHTSPKKC